VGRDSTKCELRLWKKVAYEKRVRTSSVAVGRLAFLRPACKARDRKIFRLQVPRFNLDAACLAGLPAAVMSRPDLRRCR